MNNFRMIDFHSHILPLIDNGSSSLDETYELLCEERDAGFSEIIFTPHYMINFYETQNKERQIWFETLRNKFYEFKFIKIHMASEIELNKDIINLLETNKVATINDTSYVLISINQKDEPNDIYDRIEQLRSYKLIPILAHPEKIPFIQKDPNILYDYIKKGVLVQSNYGSFINEEGPKAKKCVLTLLENNCIHFLGSDVHHSKTILPKVQYVISQLEQLTSRKVLEKICYENARLVLENKRLIIEEPKMVTKEQIPSFKTYFENISSFFTQFTNKKTNNEIIYNKEKSLEKEKVKVKKEKKEKKEKEKKEHLEKQEEKQDVDSKKLKQMKIDVDITSKLNLKPKQAQ